MCCENVKEGPASDPLKKAGFRGMAVSAMRGVPQRGGLRLGSPLTGVSPVVGRGETPLRRMGKMPMPRRGAFSLVEIMIVIVIIGLLAGVVTVNVRSYLGKAKQNVAKQDIAVIVDALDRFWSEFGRYPTTDEGIPILCQKTDKLPEPLLTKEPVDPWGRSYVYVCPGSTKPYEVLCLGPEGREGTDGVITSEDLAPKATNK